MFKHGRPFFLLVAPSLTMDSISTFRHPPLYDELHSVLTTTFPWAKWEALCRQNTLVIERPFGKPHPSYPKIIYPLNYGYVEGTLSTDGEPVDIFVGSAKTGLVGILATVDFIRKDREIKLLFDLTPQEVYTALGFMNFAPDMLQARLIMRYPMVDLWKRGA